MKYLLALVIGLTITTSAWSQILKTENDTKTGKEIKSAVTTLGNGMGQQLNFFSRGNEKLVEFVESRALESWPAKILRTMAIDIKLKNDSICHFPIDTTKCTSMENQGFLRLSLVAAVKDNQLTPLLNSPVKSISLSFGTQNNLNIPPISDNNRREIKKAVAYIVTDKK